MEMRKICWLVVQHGWIKHDWVSEREKGSKMTEEKIIKMKGITTWKNERKEKWFVVLFSIVVIVDAVEGIEEEKGENENEIKRL